jgi:AcrR family transcriptional regulator
VRGAANAQALVSAAHRLLEEQGDNFTTQDLVKEADVALQTLYRHFGGKDQLLLRVLVEQVKAHCETLNQKAADLDDPVDRLHFYVGETVSRMVDRRSIARARFMTVQHWRLHQEYPDELAAANQPFADLVQTELEAGQRAGRLHPRDPARDAWLITRLVMSVFQHYAFADQDASTAAAADELWSFCLAAVGGAPDR